ncbi:hypothetical protein [Croceicoccus sp. Ery5]|uniref:hypothetical protein n=1 Tax=Croceicoccus sp. Ery5 TaxID=1703340 RepID=UPI001E4AE16F|nr:hypothetical protein [Croceicoccus sp. Ery5]
MIPQALTEACERNKFVWHRESPQDVDFAFDDLMIEQQGEFWQFSRVYCLQFVSETLPFEMADFLEDDGQISDLVEYAHRELQIPNDLIPISTYEAESLYCVRPGTSQVVLLTPSKGGEAWDEQEISSSFFTFMLEHLR